MKIKAHNFLGLTFTEEMQRKIYEMQKKTIDSNSDGEQRDIYSNEVFSLLQNDNNRNYLMSKPSMDIAKKIRVSEEKFDGKIFAGLPTGRKITILINERLFYRYFIQDTSILCLWVTTEPIIIGGIEQVYLRYTTFRINTVNGYLSYPIEEPFKVELFERFVQYLIFLEFSELQTVTLKPNAKTHTTKKEGKYVNDSRETVVVVDSTWNKVVIVRGEFGVQGHLRLQAFGTNRQLRKLIYIDSFTKHGYVRNAKKELVQQQENA
jgi:hypothetical protein